MKSVGYFVTMGSPALTYALVWAHQPWGTWRREMLGLSAVTAGCDAVLAVFHWDVSKTDVFVYALAAAIWCRVFTLVRKGNR